LEPTRDRDNLMLRVVPSAGPVLLQENLGAAFAGGPASGNLFNYLGDLSLRLVFDRPEGGLSVASPADLEHLRVSPQAAVALAVVNLKRRNGPPRVTSSGAVYQLMCSEPDYASAYLLDRPFWRAQVEKFPGGVLAVLPRRGMLLFAPAGDAAAEHELMRRAAALAGKAEDLVLSRCAFLFTTTGWSVRSQLPLPQTRKVQATAAESAVAAEDEVQDQTDLEKAAKGQRMLVHAVMAGLVLNAYERTSGHPMVLLLLTALVTAYSLSGVVRLGSGLGKSTGHTVAFMVLTFVPLLNLAGWIFLSVQATRRLRAAGWQVGLFGARA